MLDRGALAGHDRFVIGVSGGGDSLALLHLMHAAGYDFTAVTVDHRLRAGSAEDVARVSNICARLRVPHVAIDRPGGADWGSQAKAREGRYAALARVARERSAAVAVGHTLDDQVETVRMRAWRGGGTLGLAGIAPVVTLEGCTHLVRPLLSATRRELRLYLTSHGIGWSDDPSNEDTRFERIRAREAVDAVNMRAIGRFADTCRRERGLLMRAVAADFEAGLREHAGCLQYKAALQGTALVHALRWLAAWVGKAQHLPSQARVASFVAGESALTIAGATLRKHRRGYVIEREPRRTDALRRNLHSPEPFTRFRQACDDPVFHALSRHAPLGP